MALALALALLLTSALSLALTLLLTLALALLALLALLTTALLLSLLTLSLLLTVLSLLTLTTILLAALLRVGAGRIGLLTLSKPPLLRLAHPFLHRLEPAHEIAHPVRRLRTGLRLLTLFCRTGRFLQPPAEVRNLTADQFFLFVQIRLRRGPDGLPGTLHPFREPLVAK